MSEPLEQLLPFFLVLGLLLILYVRAARGTWWWLSASNLSVYYGIALAATTVLLPEDDAAHAADWRCTVLAGVAALVLGCLAASRRGRVPTWRLAQAWYARSLEPMRRHTVALLTAVTVASVAVVIFAFLRAGGLSTLRSVLSGGGAEGLADVRKRAVFGDGYGTGDYTAAGYVAQFRDILLPMVYQSCFLALLICRRRAWLTVLCAGAMTVSLTGGLAIGQRASVVMPLGILTFLCLCRFYGSANSLPARAKRVMAAAAGMLVLAALGLFAQLTVALGRADEDGGTSAALASAAQNALHRVLVVPAEFDSKSVRLLRDYPASAGLEWARNILVVLPNPIEERITRNWSEVGTSTWLHVEHGGSQEGNAPLGRFASLWFNFRMGGVLLLGFLAGYLTQCYDRWCYGWRKTPLTIVAWQMGSLSIATATEPGLLLLTGLATSLILLALDARVAPRAMPAQPYALAEGHS